MASPARARQAPQPRRGVPAAKPAASRSLRVAEQAQPRRGLGGVGTLAILALFAVSLTLAVLHAVLVENQAALDDLVEQNRLRQERIESLLAAVAHLDSPEGLAEQAAAAELVPAPELVDLVPLGAGLLPPPPSDPFSLAGLEPSAARSGVGTPG